MQMEIASGMAQGLEGMEGIQGRWPLRLIAAACAALVLANPCAASPTAAPDRAPATAYRVIPLAPNGFPAGINTKGQVAFTEFIGNFPRARFYDGRSVRDLGTLGGPEAVAHALNDLGQVVGDASTAEDGLSHAFRWSSRTGLVDLNRPGMGYSTAYGINNRGQVVGTARFSDASRLFRAFRWSPSTGLVDLGTLGNESAALAINDAGTAVGYSDLMDSGILTVAAKWGPGSGAVALNGFPSMASLGIDINNAGQIVGSAAFDEGLNDQAFIWTRARGLQGMGTAPSYHSFAERINEKGLVIGTRYSAPVERNGFIWSRENGLLVVGTPSVDSSDTNGLNNRGEVVGNLNDRAFIWTRAGGFVDLNSRIPEAPADLGLVSAEAISDNGTIVASANIGALVLLVPQSGHDHPPVTGPVTFTGTARPNVLLSFTAAFRDVDVRDTHKAVWSWGDGSSTTGTVSEKNGSGNISGQHLYRAAGIYTVRLTVTDSSGKSSTVERKVVVCGGQHAIAGEGMFAASAPAPARAGARRTSIGSFAFLSEAGPARKAAVEVNVAGMALRSTRIDAVTIGDARVQYSGWGSVNGRGNYRFTLNASSGARTDGKDRIHVRIAHTEPGAKAEVVEYDNGVTAAVQGPAAQAKAARAVGGVVLRGKLDLGNQPGGQ